MGFGLGKLQSAIPPLTALPRAVWSCEIKSMQVADLSSKEKLAKVRLAPPLPGRRQWPLFQRVGERLCREGWPGLLAASAARPDSQVLCLFLTKKSQPQIEVKQLSREVT